MPVTVGVNGLSVVHQESGGVSIAFPDTCLTRAAPAPLPVPYPNVALSSDADQTSKQVTCDGAPICLCDSSFRMSTGDEAGEGLGVASGRIQGRATFILYSFDVKVEGKNVPRATDLMLHNDRNTPPAPLTQPAVGARVP
jgi:hypothetical protein